MTALKNRISLLIILLALPFSGLAQSPGGHPAALIRELYRVHNKGYGPVFRGKTRRYLDKYFDKALSDLIWKNLTEGNPDEVGNLDFDVLYNAQDFQIKNFQVASPVGGSDRAEVTVSFINFDRKENLKFLMRNTRAGWKIENLIYTDGSDLIKILSAPH